jgi:hypothetical protein
MFRNIKFEWKKHKAIQMIILLFSVVSALFFVFLVEITNLSAQEVKGSAKLISIILMALSVLVMITIWGRLIYESILRRSYEETLKLLTVVGSFFLWYIFVLFQQWSFSNYKLYTIFHRVGYVVMLFVLIALWRVVLYYAGDSLRHILNRKLGRIGFLGLAIGYGIFYSFASGMIEIPNENSLPDSKGFVTVFDSYGLLTSWWNLSFWLPDVHLAGSISLDAFMILVTISSFTAMGLLLLIDRWKTRHEFNGWGRTFGSSAAVTVISFSCCSLPMLYPFLLLLLNSAGAQALASFMVDQAGPMFNLIQMAILSMVSGTTIYIANQIYNVKKCDSNVKGSSLMQMH